MAELSEEPALATLGLLESRMHRVEHLLYGTRQRDTINVSAHESASQRLIELERRLSALSSNFRVYGELLKIYNSHPDFFHSPDLSQPPSQLMPNEIQAIVLASAATYHTIHSSLIAINDTPVPDTKESAILLGLKDRMAIIESTQLSQATELADLRSRSERVVKAWYEQGVLQKSQDIANIETQVELIERGIKRAEHRREADKLP